MGAFEKTALKVRTTLPADLPNAHKAQADGHPAGAAYRSDNGKLYRLVHAGWRLDARTKDGDKPTETATTEPAETAATEPTKPAEAAAPAKR